MDYTYTGLHMNVFPNSFPKGLNGLYDSPQALAELGFVVMQVDGRDSAGRSKAFHDKSYKNLGNNLEDHVTAIQYLTDRYSWIGWGFLGILLGVMMRHMRYWPLTIPIQWPFRSRGIMTGGWKKPGIPKCMPAGR